MTREFFGQYLVNQGLINALQLAEAIKLQEKSNVELGEIAQESNMLSSEQVRQILAYQMRKDLFFGQAAKELGLLTDKDIEILLQKQRIKHLFLGDALVKLGYLTEEAKNRALESFLKEEKEYQNKVIKEVPPELKNTQGFLDKFCIHAAKVLLRLAGIPAKCANYKFKGKEIVLDEITVELSFEGSLSQSLMRFSLALSEEMAKTISVKTYKKNGFATENEKGESLINKEVASDIVGEMCNIIAGQVCNEFSPQELTPGIPQAASPKPGESFRVQLGENEQAASISIITPYQPLVIYLIFSSPPASTSAEEEKASN